MDGLEQDFEVVAANASIAQQVGSGGLAGEQQDAAIGNQAADLNSGLDAAHARHDDIAEEDLGTKMARSLDRFLSAVNRDGFKAVLCKDQSEGVGDDAFVIGDQHSGPDPIVGGTRIHGALAETAEAGVLVQRV